MTTVTRHRHQDEPRRNAQNVRTESLARGLGPHKIRVNTVAPGHTITEGVRASALRAPTRRPKCSPTQLASMIGPIKDPIGCARDGTELRYADDRQVIDSGFVLSDEMRAAIGDLALGGDSVRPGLFEAFHTDDSYTECPAIATVLHARALPSSGGGNTCFMDIRAAFRLLDRRERDRILSLRAVHAYNNQGAFPPRASARGPLESLRDVAHPIVRIHPISGEPALYFDLDRATHVEGLPVDEGRLLLQSLQDHAEQSAPRYAHSWRPHDVLLWDNASVQHKASGDFALGEPRRFWRYMIAGAKPVGPTGARRETPPISDVDKD